MQPLYDPFLNHITVDIGDLQIDFLGSFSLSHPQISTDSPLHLHAKHELQYVLSGVLDELIDEETVMRVEQGCAMLIPPNTLHRNIHSSNQRLALTIAFRHIEANYSDCDFSEFTHYSELFGKLRAPIILTDEVISFYIHQLLSTPDTPQNLHKRKLLLSLLFIHVATCAEKTCPTDTQTRMLSLGSPRNHQYFLIEQFVNTHYNKKSSAADLAEILHMSRRQADRIIIEIFGKTYTDLILERRMSVAKTILKKTDIPCSSISEMLGYSSYTGFFACFKKYFKMTPNDMRDGASR